MTRRVVITGVAAFTPIGNDWQAVSARLREGPNGVVRISDWAEFSELNTNLGAPVTDFELPASYSRKDRRTMGRVAMLAVRAADLALEQAGLTGDAVLTGGRTGVAFGSSTGSTDAVVELASMKTTGSLSGMNATSYIRMMSHTTAVNIAVRYGLQGRVITTSSACTSGSQGIGYAFEAIQSGRQDVMIAGGAEELCPSEAAVFDTLYATSTRNDEADRTPRPFDANRDGLVVGEGAGAFVLEDLEHARARGAEVLGEIVGFGTNCDGQHVTRPNQATMQRAMELALEDAQLPPSAIGYVNAHGTATDAGDVAESCATADLFGTIPISSPKGHIGHTLGACGAIETWFTLNMMNEGWFAPTLNLEQVDERCGDLDYIMGGPRELQCEHAMANNFAFGGINTSLILKRWQS